MVRTLYVYNLHFARSSKVNIIVYLYFFQAPEMMYASLDLPGMVQEATKDLPDHLVKDCFSNILVTGKKNQHFTLFLNKVDFN